MLKHLELARVLAINTIPKSLICCTARTYITSTPPMAHAHH